MRLLLLCWVALCICSTLVSSKRPRREENSTFVEDPHHEASDLHELESDTLEIEAEEKGSRGRLHEKHNDSLEDTEEAPTSGGGKQDYCGKYQQHYQYYCLGDVEAETAAKFCPAYQKNCGVSGGSVVKPSNPFGKVRTPARAPVEADSFEEEGSDEEEDKQQAYYTELKKRFPCKPDCDHRIFPHCTTECKCDYIYPSVQRFCNPPPMPMFLNTCRLWYNGCPQYDKYHYASQFVYSKAEKNKVAPGPQASNPNPYNIPTPGKARQAGVAQVAAIEDNLIIPPNLPQQRHKRNAQYSSRVRRQEDDTASQLLRQYEQSGYLREGEPLHSEFAEESGQEGAAKARREIQAEPEATTRPFQMQRARRLKSVSLTEQRFVSEIVEAPRARLHAFQFQDN